MANEHKTAIARKNYSVPYKKYVLPVLKSFKGSILDYGCGRGLDSERVFKDYSFKIDTYDPFYNPIKLGKKYDMVVCFYVFNVVSVKVREDILRKISKRVKKGGKVVISVRTDLKQNISLDGYIQYKDSLKKVKIPKALKIVSVDHKKGVMELVRV